MTTQTTDTFARDLTDEEVATFRAEGFVVLGRLIDGAELEQLRTIYDELLAADLGHDMLGTDADGNRVSLRQLLKPELTYPELWHTTYFNRSRRLAAQLLDEPEDDLVGYSHLTYKPPLTGRETPWHQDEAYWFTPALLENEPRSVTIWLTLDLADEASGCMRFVPGSHDRIVPHGFIDHESSALVVLDPDRPGPCPAP